jgi:ankyrin repeat protein
MEAISSNHIDVIIVLVEAGAQLSAVDINSENAFHYAARAGCSRVIKWMIKAANLTPEDAQVLTSHTNSKLKFPEDVAANALCREILVNFRTTGQHTSSFKQAQRPETMTQTRSRPNTQSGASNTVQR